MSLRRCCRIDSLNRSTSTSFSVKFSFSSFRFCLNHKSIEKESIHNQTSIFRLLQTDCEIKSALCGSLFCIFQRNSYKFTHATTQNAALMCTLYIYITMSNYVEGQNMSVLYTFILYYTSCVSSHSQICFGLNQNKLFFLFR